MRDYINSMAICNACFFLFLFFFLVFFSHNPYLLNGIYAVLHGIKRKRYQKNVYELNVFFDVREFSIALIASRTVPCNLQTMTEVFQSLIWKRLTLLSREHVHAWKMQ